MVLGYMEDVLAAEGLEPLIYSAEDCRSGEGLPKFPYAGYSTYAARGTSTSWQPCG
jgi:hypothetical protein